VTAVIKRVGVCDSIIDTSLIEHEATSRRQFNIVGVREFMATDFPEPRKLLNPWLQDQGTAMVYGPRGLGKTHLSLGVAIALASGGRFLCWEAPDPVGVLFIDGELPAHLLQERIELAVKASNCDPVAPLNILTPDLQEGSAPNIMANEDQDLIADALDGIDVVIMDNLSTLCRGGKENNADDWQRSQDFMLRLRQMRKSVVLVHHAGKGGQQRGTSKREDILDTVIALKRPADYSSQDGARFEVHYEKARGFYGDEAEPFQAKLESDANGESVWTTMKLDESRAHQVARLHNDQGLTNQEIAAELCIHKSNVSRAMTKAREQGLIDE
jgi:putative DNA primase/helicase